MNQALIALLLQELPNLIALVESIVQDIQTGKGNVTEEQLTQVVNSVGKLTGVATAALNAAMAGKK